MAKTDAINVENPTGPSDLKLGDDYIRTLARAVVEILLVDHVLEDDAGTVTNPYDGDYAGEHKQVTYHAPITTPAAVVATKGITYLKTVAGKSELHFINEDEQEKQITSVGKLNVTDADGAVVKTGAQTIAGAKTFSDIANLKDGSVMSTSGAPTTDAMIANKKYVDDTIAAKNQSLMASGTTDIENTTGNWADMADMSQAITTTGGNVLVLFNAPLYVVGNYGLKLLRDSTLLCGQDAGNQIDGGTMLQSLNYLDTSLVAGTYTYKVQWKDITGTVYQKGTTHGKRLLTVIELPV